MGSPHVALREPENLRFVVIESGDSYELIVEQDDKFVGYALGWANGMRLMRFLAWRFVVSLFGLRVWLLRRAQAKANHAPA
jgi:hypothetical protein